MTPQKCLETRVRLGWTREELAAVTDLAAPIIRLYEAGALEGFEACEDVISAALGEGTTRRAVADLTPRRLRGGVRGGFAEASAGWRAAPWRDGAPTTAVMAGFVSTIPAGPRS